MKKLFFLLLLFGVFMVNMRIYSQVNKTIDLAVSSNNTLTEPVNANEPITFKVINKLPKGEYLFTIVKKNSLFPVLTLPTGFPNIPGLPFNEDCPDVMQLIQEMETVTDEKNIPPLIEKIEQKVKSLREELKLGTATQNCTAKHILLAEEAVENTSFTIKSIYTLEKGEDLEVTVTNIKSKKVWKVIYQAPKRGEWLTSYGFSFIWNNLNEEELYYSDGNGSTFTIKEMETNKKLDFVPSIFFTWFPYNHSSKDISTGLTAGLGFDMEAPTVFAGGSFFYNQNISFALGLVAHQQNFLRGQYTPNQELLENLTESQLHEKLYTINPFFSLTFRFGENIFKTSSE